MIQFIVEKRKNKYPKFARMSERQRLEHEMSLSILIDNQLYFYEPDFPIFEFLYSVHKWKKLKNDENFYYISIETDDNPLISFQRVEHMWQVSSPWQLFECKMRFTKEELLEALERLEKIIY